MGAKAKPNEIYLERIYDAPVKLVWDAYTDPKHAAKWWGPRGFTITTHSKDLRPGGTWNYIMHGPDGVDWPNIATYHEVEKYSRLVYDHGATETTPPLFRVTVNFIDLKGKQTKMEMTMAFENVERAKEIGKFIKQAGGNSTWDRLGEYLEKEQTGTDKFMINRSFNAPIEVMYDMFTKPEHIAKWLAPTGMDMTYLKADIKTGGSAHFRMSDGKGFSLHNNVQYLELRKPDLILYTQQFSDANGNAVRAPFNNKWPMTMQTRIELTKEDEHTTRATVTWEIVGDVTKDELEVFINERPGMTVGWTGSFDKLEEYIASR